jgi:Cu/Ag efflux protein CusF
MKRWILLLALLLSSTIGFDAHNVGSSITWNREISRIVYERCASCHRDGGTAFSLMNYQDVQPRVLAFREAVLSRRMPPWGAVKGFGDFRNDGGLSQQELDLITDWVDSDAPRGNNPNALPKTPKFGKDSGFKPPKDAITVSGEVPISRPLIVDGLFPQNVPPGVSAKIVAALPNGDVEPLLWLYEYKDAYQHPFLYRKPVELPSGTIIRGVPDNSKILLLPGKKAAPRVKEFTFSGRVEKVDTSAKTLIVNSEKVSGWMDAMTMTYSVDKNDILKVVKPGDRITARVYEGDFRILHDVRVSPAK